MFNKDINLVFQYFIKFIFKLLIFRINKTIITIFNNTIKIFNPIIYFIAILILIYNMLIILR